MLERLLKRWGLTKQSKYVRMRIYDGNIFAALYVSLIIIVLETWMMLSLTRMVIESAAAGTPRDPFWVINHGAWYVVLMGFAIAMAVYARRYLQGKTYNTRVGTALLVAFSVVSLIFGIHFGNNSYVKGEQILSFVTMTLFVFGLIVWRPIPTFFATAITFGVFYLYIDHNLPATYGTQVNLFTLWLGTFVVALSSYRRHVSEAEKDEHIVEANEKLRKIASFDELTGIPNMHSFNSAMSVLFEGVKDLDVHYSVMYMDLENFKSYNDKYGFREGDNLLRQIAEGLQEIFDGELVARFSDDHFVTLGMSETTEERARAASELVERLRGDVRLQLKVGVFEPDMQKRVDPAYACDKARIACNNIKRHPGVFLCRYDEDLDTLVRRRQHIINNVDAAVTKDWIKVYYQPVVRCADGSAELCGYEALARWDDPEFGFMPPFAFVETLEEFREIDKLDRCIIEQVCRDLRAELEAGGNPVPVSLNFSRLDFELYDVSSFLQEMSQKYGIPSELLDVEITESALTQHVSELRRNMEALREENFSLWLDDFGSGYSSLNVLKDFQFKVLKIDMAFLRGFENNDKARPILRSIVDLARELDMVTLCEGVETREQFEFLSSIGCDRAQGYLFGKPGPTKEIPNS